MKGINKRLMKAKLKHYKKRESKNMILIWKSRCLNALQISPFISQNLKLLIWWLIVEWVTTLDLVTILIFLSEQNIITNVRIWTDYIHTSSRKLSQLSNKKRIGAFGLLELEIWAEQWIVSGIQDRFWLLRCCYNLNLKMALLNLGLPWTF